MTVESVGGQKAFRPEVKIDQKTPEAVKGSRPAWMQRIADAAKRILPQRWRKQTEPTQAQRAAKAIREYYGLRPGASEKKLRAAQATAAAKAIRSYYDLPVTASEAELQAAQEQAAADAIRKYYGLPASASPEELGVAKQQAYEEAVRKNAEYERARQEGLQ